MKPLTITDYARHRKATGLAGGTLRAVQVAIESGRLSGSLTDDNKIRDAAEADAEWLATTASDKVPLTGPTAPAISEAARPVNGLAEARTRREAAQASLREMELAERQGELVAAKDVEAHLANVFAQCRAKLLAIPARARQSDPSLSGSHLVLFEALIREALEALADGSSEADAG